MKKMENWRDNQAITYGLISAVREGNLEKTRELIKSFGLSYSEAWSQGYVLLCDALKNRHATVAKLLLTSGSKVDIKNEEPTDTPLHFAVMNNNIKIVEMILDNGANPDAKNGISKTPLHVASENGYLQIVEHLLEHAAHVNCVCTWKEDYTPLHFAVQRGHTEVITLLLRRGANVNAKGEDCITPLHIAAKFGYKDTYIHIAEILLNHGACIHSSTLKDGYTPLHFASERGKEETVKLLLNRGADINARTKDNSTPLHVATKEGRETLVKLLLQHEAKVDEQDKDGKTILLIAVERQNLTIVEDILKHCPDTNDRSNRSSLKFAVYRYEEKYKNIIEALLEYGFIVNPGEANDSKLLHYAVQKGYSKIIEDLLKYGADVNTLWELGNNRSFQSGFTPLHSAAKNKQEEVAKLLISYEANINSQEKTGKAPIFYAIENVDLKMTKLLLNNRAEIKGRPELLNMAVEKECIEIIEVLLQHDADINASDENGRTALHFTAPSEDKGTYIRKKNPDMNLKRKIAELLLRKGANVNTETKDGVTTLHAAAEKGYAKVVEVLLEYNANVHCKDKNDNTPLHISARKGNKDISIMLLDKEANVNAKQKDGISPLHLAAQESHGEIVKVLLENGAEVDSKMKNDMTPLHLAAEKEYPEIIKTILEFGADIHSRDKDGRIALHIASEHGAEEVVAILLDHGSNINITGKNNRTALDYAIDGISSFYNQVNDCDSDEYYSEDDFSSSYRFVDLDQCSHKHIADALRHHIVKMKTANLFVSEKYSGSIDRRHGMSAFQDECEVEIARMKNKRIRNSNFSFYDILAKDTSLLAMYMRNEDIAQILELYDYERAFPIYASMIKSYFREGMKKYDLLNQGHKSFHFLSKDLPKLPYDCTEKVISCLSDEDLRNLIDSRKPLGISNSHTNIDNVAITPNISQV